MAGLWAGKIWQTFASIMAQDIPPKKPILLELIPLLSAHTFITLKVCLKFYAWSLPASSKIIKLFFLPSKAVLLGSSSIDYNKSMLITLSMSLGTVSVGNRQ